MPTYDYQCRSCGHTIEVIHSMLEEGPTTCERCGGQLRRVLFPAGIIFKGSGFYKTDSRAAGSGAATAGASKASGGDGAPEGGSDSSADAGAATPKAPDAPKRSVTKESAGT